MWPFDGKGKSSREPVAPAHAGSGPRELVTTSTVEPGALPTDARASTGPAEPAHPHAPRVPVVAPPAARGIGPEELHALLSAVLATIENWTKANNLPPVPPGVLLGQVNSILQARNVALHMDERGRPW